MTREIADIGSRLEMFIDKFLIESMEGATLKLHPPVKREIVMKFDCPWEDNLAFCTTVLKDGDVYRFYYRGCCPTDNSDAQVACLAESSDGIHFEKPSLGLIEHDGSTDNNIIYKGAEAHNLMPFIDTNPKCKPEERYKAVGGGWLSLYGFVSPDGLRWRKIREAPLEITGQFDSPNLAFYDNIAGCYRSFSRYFDGGWPEGYRAIQSATSDDFVTWTTPEPHRYAPDIPTEHLYTNATTPCPGAEHILICFPKRFMPTRKKVDAHPHEGLSETVLMTSRDGVNWDRTFMEAWMRPGLDERNWTERSNLTAWGILQMDDAEYSMYASEHYRWDDLRYRRMTIRRHGFASVNALYAGGEFTTRPVIFTGAKLVLNYSTSVAGSVQVELRDENGVPLGDHGIDDMEPLFGDELERIVEWKTGSNLSGFAGRPVRLRFVMKDADVFALSFR